MKVTANNKKYLLVGATVALATVVGLGTYAYNQRTASRGVQTTNVPNGASKATPMPTPMNDGGKTVTAGASATPAPVAADTKDAMPQATPSAASSYKPQLTGAPDVAGDNVIVTALTDPATSGTCTATYTNQGQTVTGTGAIQRITDYYACKVAIPRAKFTAGSTWTVTVTVNSPGITGTSDSASFKVAS